MSLKEFLHNFFIQKLTKLLNNIINKSFIHQLTKKLNIKVKMKYIITLSIALQVNLANAQTIYTLNQCIEEGLKNNLQIKAAENEVLKTKYQVGEARSALLPQISGGLDYTYYFDLAVQALPASVFGGPQGEFIFSALGVKQVTAAKVDASLQVFNPQILIALKAVKVAGTINATQLRKTKEDIAYNISSTYYNLLTLYQTANLLDSNIANLNKLIASAEILAKNNLAKKTDVDRLILTKKGIEVQKVNITTSINYLLNLLKLLMGKSETETIAINQNNTPSPTLNASETNGITKNITLELLEIQKSIKVIEQKSIWSSYIPNITAFGSYGSQAFNDQFKPFERLSNKSYPVSLFGLKLSVPIFDGGNKHYRIQQKNIEIRNTDIQYTQLKQQLQTELSNTIAKYNSSIDALKLEEDNVSLAKRIFDENQLLYKQGLVAITDVISTQNDLLKNEANRLKAIVSIKQSILEIQKINGSILNN